METDIDLADLTAKAEAATPGPWKVVVWNASSSYGNAIADSDGDMLTEGLLDYDAAFIAAMGPDVAKALIARVERAEAALREVKTWRSWYATGEAPSPSEWRVLDGHLAANQEGTTTDGR